jgi:enhancer of polycomb-like protein
MDQEIPDYDMDSEDEAWLSEQAKKMEITPLKFEEMLDRLEKGSGQQVVTIREAKLLLKEDDDLIIAVYDYWLNKRLRTVSFSSSPPCSYSFSLSIGIYHNYHYEKTVVC